VNAAPLSSGKEVTMSTQKLTLSTVRAQLRLIGVVITRTEYAEYRVNFARGREATAYYTPDLDDALATGVIMTQSLEVRA
jgi:hypothetical protein